MKPELKYIEIEITQQCNLNCHGCGHFSNINHSGYYDLQQFEKDLEKLHMLFSNIETIRLMGGEPLLNKDIVAYLEISRHYFPISHISIVTNGILLDRMEQSFWDKCKQHNIAIDLSVYPTVEINQEQLNKLYSGIEYNQRWWYSKYLNPKGDSDPYYALDNCKMGGKKALLVSNGRIYPCPPAMNVHVLNTKFNTQFPETNGLDLYNVTGEEILLYRDTPNALCRFCCTPKMVEWSNKGAPELVDWLI